MSCAAHQSSAPLRTGHQLRCAYALAPLRARAACPQSGQAVSPKAKWHGSNQRFEARHRRELSPKVTEGYPPSRVNDLPLGSRPLFALQNRKRKSMRLGWPLLLNCGSSYKRHAAFLPERKGCHSGMPFSFAQTPICKRAAGSSGRSFQLLLSMSRASRDRGFHLPRK